MKTFVAKIVVHDEDSNDKLAMEMAIEQCLLIHGYNDVEVSVEEAKEN